MKYWMLWILWGTLFAERGIVVTCNDKYAPSLCISLSYLRNELQCDLPCEVWHAGKELSLKMKEKLEGIAGVKVRDVLSFMPPPASEYWGWHVKPIALFLSSFDEALLMDADLYFFQNPACLFDHLEYEKTGAFFFRDRRIFVIPYERSGIQNRFAKERGNFAFYAKQCQWLQRIIPVPSSFVPEDWRHYWTGNMPSKEEPVSTEKQEAGCVLVDKRRHQRGLEEVLKLNRDRKFVYSMVYGDKETYWIGFEVAEEPYYVNPEHAVTLHTGGGRQVQIIQFLKGKLFYQQKEPVELSKESTFYEHLTGSRQLLQEEKASLEGVRKAWLRYKSY